MCFMLVQALEIPGNIVASHSCALETCMSKFRFCGNVHRQTNVQRFPKHIVKSTPNTNETRTTIFRTNNSTMHLQQYELRAGRTFTTFEFVSEGRNGRIIKVVQFQRMDYPNVYNLVFGDKNSTEGYIDDLAVTDNGDSEKVLATVVAAIYLFADQHPGSWIYATGSTDARTRLYRMGINKYFDSVQNDFNVMGEHESEWEWYEKGKDYQAFAVQKKIVNLSYEVIDENG